VSRRVLNIFLPALTGALVLAIWHAIHLALSEDLRFLLPTPGAILRAFDTQGDALARAALNTTKGALLTALTT
jgi:ABC-type nitrate/sulfonate/bicarbonate transport system permease component